MTTTTPAFKFATDPTFYDWHTGQPLASPYQGLVTVYNGIDSDAIMNTWIDASGERNWQCIEVIDRAL